ncbi:hypothetical protein ACFFGH_03265 [Lysobacter korlensis]|uniref:AlgX/AlgJ SGNH hydrolase-like domain-containing protein n=1 Tax=Lysobacter korlensis TaxID=553636 RepID=A0ABV6RIQ8_9GAMM
MPDIQTQEPRRWGLVSAAVAMLLALHAVPRFLDAPAIAENRELASLPAWPAAGADWWALPKQLDTYVQDRFAPRAHLIGALNWLRMQAGDSGSSRVVVGRNGWLFYNDGSHLGAARAATPLLDSEVDRWVSTLQGRVELAAEAEIPYVVLVPPVKERVYPENAPSWMKDGGAAVDGERLRKAAEARGLNNVLYLTPAMARARRSHEPVYSPYDIHWTGFGAYEGYVELANHLKSRGVPIEVWPLSRYTRTDQPGNLPRDVALMLGVADFVTHEFPSFAHAETSGQLKTEYLTQRHDWTGARVIDTGHSNKPVLLLTGDSFSNDLLPFLYPHFSRLIVAHNQDGYFRQDLIEQFRPDAIVLEILESGVRHAMTPALDPESMRAGRDADNSKNALSAAKAVQVRPFRWESVSAAALSQWKNAEPTACNFEVARRSGSGSAPGLSLEGWMFASKTVSGSGKTSLVLADGAGNAWVIASEHDLPRPDVAAHFGAAEAADSGFSVDVPVPPGAKGKLEVFAIREHGPRVLLCPTIRTVES